MNAQEQFPELPSQMKMAPSWQLDSNLRRERIATAALQGLLADLSGTSPAWKSTAESMNEDLCTSIVHVAIHYADTLIAELDKKP